MNRSHAFAKALLWTIAIYHLATGALLIASGKLAIRFARASYGWTIEGSPELGIVGELLGCYAIAFGLMMAAAARDPLTHRPFITIGIVLILLRLFQRAYFSAKIEEVFAVPPGRHWGAFAFLALLAAGLAYVRYDLSREAGPAGRRR